MVSANLNYNLALRVAIFTLINDVVAMSDSVPPASLANFIVHCQCVGDKDVVVAQFILTLVKHDRLLPKPRQGGKTCAR